MSYLTILRKEGENKKELNIISLQQVVGRHIILPHKSSIKNLLLSQAIRHPEKYTIKKEKPFTVFSPNNQDITYSGNGTCPWVLVIARKNLRQQVKLLFIGNRIWGIELDQGMKLKREVKRFGTERLSKFLIQQVNSLLNQDNKWQNIEIFLRE